MAGELQFSFGRTGRTCYFVVRNRVAQAWNTSGGTGAFETYTTAVYSSYVISATEQGTASGYYAGNFPTAIPPGVYSVTAKDQLGGSPAETDPTVAVGDVQWNGTVVMPLSDTATSGQLGQAIPIKIARGVAVSGFPFKMVSSADHVTPFVSGVISGQINRDGGGWNALQSGNVTEMGYGWYRVNLTSGDLNAGVAALLFTGNGISGGTSDQRDFALVLQKVSGSI